MLILVERGRHGRTSNSILRTMRKLYAISSLFPILAIFLTWTCIGAETFLGQDYPIWISPVNDFAVEYGKDIELYCSLTSNGLKKNLTSKNMNFTFNWAHEGTTNLTTILNETTIMFTVKKPKPGERMFYCHLYENRENTTAPVWVRPISVVVGTKPEAVDDFNCISYNWSILNCTWTPKANPMKTTYRLFIRFKGKAGSRPLACPNSLDVYRNMCIYNDTNYRQSHKQFFFTLNGTNDLGVTSQTFEINHYEIVKPNPPINLTHISKTTNSCLIEWGIPHPMPRFPIGLEFFIEVKSEYDASDIWLTYPGGNITKDREKCQYNITGLKYANAGYDVRVYLKSPEAPNTLKSTPATYTFVTLPTVPNKPPSTTVGSFDFTYTNHSYLVNIYWRRILKQEQCGNNFEYNVTCLRNGRYRCDDDLVKKTETFAEFKIFAKDFYNFSVYSVNEVGRSAGESWIFVPKLKSVPGVVSPTKSAYGNGTYGVTWSHSNAKINSYTVFYCEEDKEEPLPCRGSMDWEEVPANVTSKIIVNRNYNKFYQFGVAANERNGRSSGITWATCVISNHNIIDIRVTASASALSSKSAYVTWQFGCTVSSTMLGFYIHFCPVSYSEEIRNEQPCEGPEEKVKVRNAQARNITIYNLSPYTTYKFEVSAYLLLSNGQETESVRSLSARCTTLEDAPDPPTNLRAVNITKSSLVLTWDLPKNRNGVLKRFQITRPMANRNTTEQIDVHDPVPTYYEIRDLDSSSSYSFFLAACTANNCSSSTALLDVKTKIDQPAKMHQPQVTVSNYVANVSWEKPRFVSNSYYYELYVNFTDQQEVFTIEDGNASSFAVPIKESCEDDENFLLFSIRAINLDLESNNTYASPLSDFAKIQCHYSGGIGIYAVVFTLAGIILVFILFLILFYLVKRGIIKCKEMRNVVVRLPTGLEPPPEMERMQDYTPLDTWPPQVRVTTDSPQQKVCIRCDEETLLDKKSMLDDEKKDIGCSSSEVSDASTRDRHTMPWENLPKARIECTSADSKDENEDYVYYHQDGSDWQQESPNSVENSISNAGYTKIGSETRTVPDIGYVAVVNMNQQKSSQSPTVPATTSPYVAMPTTNGPSVQESSAIKPSAPVSSYVTLSDLKASKCSLPSTSDCSSMIIPEVPDVQTESAKEENIKNNASSYVSLPVVPQESGSMFANYVPHTALNGDTN